MRSRNQRLAWWMAGVLSLGGIVPVLGELPSLSETEWIGYFVGIQNKKMQFGITTKGRASLRPLNAKGLPLGQRLALMIAFEVEETHPDGTITVHPIVPGSLKSTDPATTELQTVKFQGQVKGGATFEVTVEEAKGSVALGGRLLASGEAKNPMKFTIAVKIPNAYPSISKAGDRKLEKAFADKTKDDQVVLTTQDGKRIKLDPAKSDGASLKDVPLAGISAASVDFSSYQGKNVELSATAGSAISLPDRQKRPLNEGFTMKWGMSSATDSGGKSRLIVTAK